MSQHNNNLSIEEWANKKDRKNSEVIKLLALAYIKENKIEWNTSAGKVDVNSYIDELYYGKTRNLKSFDEKWMGNQDDKPFEFSLDEVFPIDINDDIKKDDVILEKNQNKNVTIGPIKLLPEKNNFIDQITSLNFPLEIKEILKELDDKSYTSTILTNLDNHGRLKLIRKAKIFIYLYKKVNTIN